MRALPAKKREGKGLGMVGLPLGTPVRKLPHGNILKKQISLAEK